MLGDVTLSSLPRMPRGVDGLLGLPAFADLLLTIDYPRHRVRLERDTLPAPDGQSVLPTSRASDFVAIPRSIRLRDRSNDHRHALDDRICESSRRSPGSCSGRLNRSSPAAPAARAFRQRTVSRGVFGETIGVGRYEFLSAPLTVHALPPDFPHDPRIGAGALQYFAFSLDQRTGRARASHATVRPRSIWLTPRPAAATTATVKLDDYVGTYGERTISFRDGKLFLLRTGGEPLEMTYIGPDRFGLVRVAEARIEFSRDAAGRVTSIGVLAPTGQWERANRQP